MGILRRLDRGQLAVGGILLVVVFFFSLNLLAGAVLHHSRLDLTEERLYTLSEGTKEVLAGLEEPVTLRYYRSEDLDILGPLYVELAQRVDDLLVEYEERAGGLLEIERYDPEPFSPEEDQAVAEGLQGIQVEADGTQVFFGISGLNLTDDRMAIPLLTPERANFLEYDLTRLVANLSDPEKPKVAVASGLPLRGSQFNQFQSWAITDTLRQFFELTFLPPDFEAIDPEVTTLLLAQPGELPEASLYAIDQFVLRGGRVLAFVDPLAEVEQRRLQPDQPPPADSVAALEPLLESWGVAIDGDQLVGDRLNATRVQTTHQGRDVVVDYLVWLGLPPDRLDADDVVTADLKHLNLRSAGFIAATGAAGTRLEPMVTSSQQSMLVDQGEIAMAPDPVGLLNRFEPSGQSFTLAARISGPVQSAFGDSAPDFVQDEALRAAHRAASEEPANIILVADADLLADPNWVRRQNLAGRDYQVPFASNGDFVINALDNLSGSEGLIALRGRGLNYRPFEVLQVMQREAEDRYRAKEQELLRQIEETRARIQELQRQEQESGVILTGEQQQEIDRFRQQMLDLRGELREVQRALRQEVESLETWLKVLNIWAVPLAVGLVALGLALYRRLRARRGGGAWKEA